MNADGSALIYSTYLGGDGGEIGFGIALSASGNAYVTGSTASTNFPVQSAFQGASADATTGDGFVTKLNPQGNALVYSTYLGGSNFDEPNAIAVDGDGNAHVTGRTSSTDFPTLSALQANNAGVQDAFVTKFDAGGSALVYSTYLGGSVVDNARGIAVDPAGNAYVAGLTFSENFPVQSPLQGSRVGFVDAFIAKISGPAILQFSAAAYSVNEMREP